MKILRVKIDNLNKKEILQKVEDFLSEEKFHQIVTVNPEFILMAQENNKFLSVLNQSDLNIVDGFGIKLAGFLKGHTIKSRYPGIDLMQDILKIAEKNNLKVFFLCNSKGLTQWEDLKKVLKIKYKKLKIAGVSVSKNKSLTLKIKQEISNFVPEIVFCNWGAPEQEIELSQLKIYPIRLVMGTGGSFDFISKKISRAPLWMRKIGIEWLYRFWQQPWRWKRIFRAVVIFPYKILRYK